MTDGFFRERKHYKLYDIAKGLDNTSLEETKRLVGILKKYGIVKAVKASKPEFEDLSDADIILTDVVENNSEIEYVFDFVGVIMLEQKVFKCYPKYIHSSDQPMEQLKQVLKVIKKYNEKEQLVYLFNGEDEDKLFNRLAVSLHLLEDYFQNGIYTNQHEVIEVNGQGEILWDKTINETFAFIQNNRPYYVELQTWSSVDNEMDYIRRLHECVLSECSRELKNAGMLELFDLSEAELTNSFLDDFGDMDYIKYRLENEMKQQFVTRKQTLLKTLYTYISNAKVSQEDVSYSLYGTNSFNLVWEDVCKQNFGNLLETQLSKLPKGVCKEYVSRKSKKLIDIIDKPVWSKNDLGISAKADTLKPDLVCIYPMNKAEDYCFGIFDAKYYCIDFVPTKDGYKVVGQPGIGDVTKQYLYQLAYEDFAQKQGYKQMINMFLCPHEESILDYGFVSMQMLKTLGNGTLSQIYVVKLCAEEMFDYYIQNRQISNIFKYLPDLISKDHEEKRFTNRLAAYARKFLKHKKMTENEEQDLQVVYPEILERKVGAKLIYDVLYPMLDKTFLSYQNPRGSLAAYDGMSQRRESLAGVAIELEKKLADLPKEQLEDEHKIRELFMHCITNMDNLRALANEDKVDSVFVQLYELINKLYT